VSGKEKNAPILKKGKKRKEFDNHQKMKINFKDTFQYSPIEGGYYSLNHQSPKVSFAEATVKGQAPDKGLYFPEQIPNLSKEFINNIRNYSKEELSFLVMKPYVCESIPDNVLEQIVRETINFEFPLIKLSENIYSLELFHGPTLAFKDVGARFMSRCLSYFNRNAHQHITILVATSGDTGGAVANGFLGVEGVEVVILYPSGKVSPIQELQLTTCGQNITALEVNGTFDDCQAIVKQAFSDDHLNKKLVLTSANSINVARWLPQQLYYFFAYQQWQSEQPPIIAVPSGNFGNICAGILAHISGLPVKHFIAACNANNVITSYLKSGEYKIKPSVATISNAMDVGNPSNFVRILELFHNEYTDLKKVLSSYSANDTITKQTIEKIYQQYHYTLDPHGAVGYYALEQYLQHNQNNEKGIVLETAHPVKFQDVVEDIICEKITVPANAQYLLKRKKQSIQMNVSFDALKEWLLN
jgi:threonine synthase